MEIPYFFFSLHDSLMTNAIFSELNKSFEFLSRVTFYYLQLRNFQSICVKLWWWKVCGLGWNKNKKTFKSEVAEKAQLEGKAKLGFWSKIRSKIITDLPLFPYSGPRQLNKTVDRKIMRRLCCTSIPFLTYFLLPPHY
jgi:hypothetical protein